MIFEYNERQLIIIANSESDIKRKCQIYEISIGEISCKKEYNKKEFKIKFKSKIKKNINNITLKYNAKSKKKIINLFGEDFVKENKKKCKMILNNKSNRLAKGLSILYIKGYLLSKDIFRIK